MSKLNARQQRFMNEYLIDLNGTAAYRRAFPGCSYKSAKTAATRLLSNVVLRAEIAAARKVLGKQARTSAAKVIRAIGHIAFLDVGDVFDLSCDGWKFRPLRDVPLETRQSIAAMKVRRTSTVTRTLAGGELVTETCEVISIKLCDKLRALDMLARHLGLYAELPPLQVLLQLLPADLAASVRAELSKQT
ncbi:terminase small subunit [Gemmata sp.]|uniref:terminase small subunit n=1 Tax=Gemmata sp. TaxID=1914242 RepID=UPI003F71E918